MVRRAPSSQRGTEKPKERSEVQRVSSGQKSDERPRGRRMTKRVRLHEASKTAPSGRGHLMVRERLGVQERIEWSGSRAASRAPSGWIGAEFPGGLLNGSLFLATI